MRPCRLLAVFTALAFVGGAIAPGPCAFAAAVPDPPATSAAPADAVLVVSSYATTPGEVTVGGRFTLSVTVANRTSRKAEEVVVSLGDSAAPAAASGESAAGSGATAAGSNLVVLGTGNVKFIGTVAGKKAESVSFSLIVSPSAGPGVYSVPVTISRLNSGEVRSSQQTIGVLVRRSPVFEFGVPKIPRTAVAGEPFEVSAEIVNDSGYTVKGLVYGIEGSGLDVVEGRTAVGSLDTGDSEAVSARCTAPIAGEATVTLVVSYRDDFNETRTVRRDFPVKVEGRSADTTSSVETTAPPTGSESVFEQVGAFFLGLLGLGG